MPAGTLHAVPCMFCCTCNLIVLVWSLGLCRAASAYVSSLRCQVKLYVHPSQRHVVHLVKGRAQQMLIQLNALCVSSVMTCGAGLYICRVNSQQRQKGGAYGYLLQLR